jgi:hypothetical protein
MKLKLLCWFLVAFAVVSCKESYVTPDTEARGLKYYPLMVGQYRVYDVTDIRYQHNNATQTNFQMREWVADSFMNQTNTLTYKIIRSVRADAQSEWLDDSVFLATKDYNRVILTKDNTRYVKMVFPVKESKTWEADALNDRKLDNGTRELHMFTDINRPFTLNSTVYDSTLTIIQGEPGVISSRFSNRFEVYAKNIGLIYRLFDVKNYDNCIELPCTSQIIDGHERHETLISYGKL